MVSGLVVMSMFGIVRSKHSLILDIRTAEVVHWSWSGALKGCLWGLAFGMLVWIAWLPWGGRNLRDFGVEIAVKFLLAYLIAGGEIGAILLGLENRIAETKAVPNEGIVLTIKNILKVGLLSWAIYGLTMWSILNLLFRKEDWFPKGYGGELFSFYLGLFFFSMSALILGGVDVLKHYLLRSILFLTGQTPRKYAHFLDHATQLNFLQKVGGGYIFVHRILLEHFGAIGENERRANGVTS